MITLTAAARAFGSRSRSWRPRRRNGRRCSGRAVRGGPISRARCATRRCMLRRPASESRLIGSRLGARTRSTANSRPRSRRPGFEIKRLRGTVPGSGPALRPDVAAGDGMRAGVLAHFDRIPAPRRSCRAPGDVKPYAGPATTDLRRRCPPPGRRCRDMVGRRGSAVTVAPRLLASRRAAYAHRRNDRVVLHCDDGGSAIQSRMVARSRSRPRLHDRESGVACEQHWTENIPFRFDRDRRRS